MDGFSDGPMNEFSFGPIHCSPCRKIRLRSVNEFSVGLIHGPLCRRIRLRSVNEFSVVSQEPRPGGGGDSQKNHDLG